MINRLNTSTSINNNSNEHLSTTTTATTLTLASTSSNLATLNTKNPPVASSDSIRLIGESIGISNLSEEACRDLASDLTFTIKSILQDALKFTRNSKRKRLLIADIDYALKFRTSEVYFILFLNLF
jgi:histone H3/H4